MRNGARMRKRAAAALIMSAALSFLIICAFLQPGAAAYAAGAAAVTLPSGWAAAADDGDEWFLGEDYLDLAAVREETDAMLADSDLEALAADPVVIAVIDTGVVTRHEIFGYGTDEDVFLRVGSNIVALNAINGTSDVYDGGNDFHGTHVAGIVALLIRALGLSDYIKIMPIKAGQHKGAGNVFEMSDVRDAVEFATDNGADVVNLSFGAESSRWKDAVTEQDAEEAVFVAAAGNYHNDSDSILQSKFYPAANDHVIGVMNYEEGANGAEMHVGEKGKGSNYGSLYDVCAPGTDILSADGATSGYKTMTGTSMAAPMVSFAVALLELKCRAEGVETDATQLAEMFLMTFTDTLEYDDEEYPVMSLDGVMGAEYRYDASGGIYLSAAATAVPAAEAEPLTLGESVEVTLTADCGYINAGAKFVWSYVSGGTPIKSEGGRLKTKMVATDIGGIDVTLSVFTPDGAVLLNESTVTLAAEYFVPTSENSLLTLSKRAGEDGSVPLSDGETLVLGVDTLKYASPDCEVVWIVNGEAVSNDGEFEFEPDADGTYVITVTVNGSVIGDPVTVVASGIAAARNAVIIGASCAAGAVAAAGLGVLIAVILKKRKAGQGEDEPAKTA